MAQDNTPQAQKSLIGRWLSRITTIAVWLLLALLMSIITEWIGMNTKWKDEGIEQSRGVVKQRLPEKFNCTAARSIC